MAKILIKNGKIWDGEKFFYGDILTNDKHIEKIEEEISNEEKKQIIVSEPQIRFFLNSLKKGNANDERYRQALVNTFINKIFLYDDKLTFIFNSGDEPITINDTLLSDIEEDSCEDNSLCFNNIALPKIIAPIRVLLIFVLAKDLNNEIQKLRPKEAKLLTANSPVDCLCIELISAPAKNNSTHSGAINFCWS